MKFWRSFGEKGDAGFTLPELMITVAIVSILSGVALPIFMRQIQRSHQSEASSSLSQLVASLAAYTDEYGVPPETWDDLNLITTVMTNEGPARSDNGALTNPIDLPGERYQLMRSNGANNSGYFEIMASPSNIRAADFNIVACVDLSTGASSMVQGRPGNPGVAADLKCRNGSE